MIRTFPSGKTVTVRKDGKEVIIPMQPRIVLQNTGPMLKVRITHPKSVIEKLTKENKEIPAIELDALIDTGAFGSVISPKVAEELRLVQTGFADVTSVNNTEKRPAYFAMIQFPWGKAIEVPVVSCPIHLQNLHCLIGRDVMAHWNLMYNGREGYFVVCD